MANLEILYYENNKQLDYHECMIELFDLFNTGITVRYLIQHLLNNKSDQTNVGIKCYEKISDNILPHDCSEFFYCKKTQEFYLIHNLKIFADVLECDTPHDLILDQPCNTLAHPVSKNFEIEIHKLTIDSLYIKKDSSDVTIGVNVRLFNEKNIIVIEIDYYASVYHLKKEISKMKDMRPCDLDIVSLGKKTNDLSYVVYHASECIIFLFEKSSSKYEINSKEENYCSVQVESTEAQSKEIIRYVRFNYDGYPLHLLFHPKCQANRIKQMIEIETNKNYFIENPNVILDSLMIRMLSDTALNNYCSRQ